MPRYYWLGEADNVDCGGTHPPRGARARRGQDKGRVIGSWVYSLPVDLPRPDDGDDDDDLGKRDSANHN